MYGQKIPIHHYAFINVNLTFYSIDRSNNEKYLCDSSFEIYFLRK